MSASDAYEQFVDNEEGYLRWLGKNPLGFVVNSERTPKAGYLVLHRASCKHINSPNRANWTTAGYIKTCSTQEDSLAEWARREIGGELSPCGACKPVTTSGSGTKSKSRDPKVRKTKNTAGRERGSEFEESSPVECGSWRKRHTGLILWVAATFVTAFLCPLIVELIKSRSSLFAEMNATVGAGGPADPSGSSQPPAQAHGGDVPTRSGRAVTPPLGSHAITPSQGKSSRSSLEGLLKELPSLLVAEVSTKPTYDSKTSELVLEVIVGVDRRKFDEVRDRLVEALETIAYSKGTTLIRAKSAEFNGNPQQRLLVDNDHPGLAGPAPEQAEGKWCVWVASFSDEARTTSRWSYYLIDPDLGEVGDAISMPRERVGGRISRSPAQGRTTVMISARGEGGASVTEDEFELLADGDLDGISSYPGRDDQRLPFLCDRLSLSDGRNYLLVAPCSFLVKPFPGPSPTWSLFYQAEVVVQRRIKMSADEAARIKNLSCSVSYQPGSSTEG